MSTAKDRGYVTGSMGDNIDNFPITRENPEDIEMLLDEWEKGKIRTRLSRDELKRMIVKTGDFTYKLDLPIKEIIGETIPFIIAITPNLYDPRKEETKQND